MMAVSWCMFHPRFQRSLPGRGCYPACRRQLGAWGGRAQLLSYLFFKETKKMCAHLREQGRGRGGRERGPGPGNGGRVPYY